MCGGQAKKKQCPLRLILSMAFSSALFYGNHRTTLASRFKDLAYTLQAPCSENSLSAALYVSSDSSINLRLRIFLLVPPVLRPFDFFFARFGMTRPPDP
jgi:hypothetical protein